MHLMLRGKRESWADVSGYEGIYQVSNCDPPYVQNTRNKSGEYGSHEMSDEDHERLLAKLSAIQGKFLLSGYRSELYDDHASMHGWRLVEKAFKNSASSKGAKPECVECLWMNYRSHKESLASH